MREKVLLIDAANMYMRCLHVIPYDPTDNFYTAYNGLLTQMFKNALLQFNGIDRVVFCQEGFNNWRKQEYSLYKANRVEKREASDVDFDAFYKNLNAFIHDFQGIAKNFQFLQVPNCEADDLIAVITKYKQNCDIITLSSDKDFYQLYKYKNYKQWHPTKKQFIEVVNPVNYLTAKIITGDAGDNVPRISGLKYRQGPKFIEKKIIPNLDAWLDENKCRDEWERNYKLIAFDAIPEEHCNSIISEFDSWEKGKFDARGFYNFMFTHKLQNQIDFITDFVNAFSKV